jgi:hypothetical protein
MWLVGHYNNGNISIVSLNEERDNILLDESYKNLLDRMVNND